jgi:hypothetical protein
MGDQVCGLVLILALDRISDPAAPCTRLLYPHESDAACLPSMWIDPYLGKRIKIHFGLKVLGSAPSTTAALKWWCFGAVSETTEILRQPQDDSIRQLGVYHHAFVRDVPPSSRLRRTGGALRRAPFDVAQGGQGRQVVAFPKRRKAVERKLDPPNHDGSGSPGGSPSKRPEPRRGRPGGPSLPTTRRDT